MSNPLSSKGYEAAKDLVATESKSIASAPEEDMTFGINKFSYDEPEFGKLTSREKMEVLLKNPEILDKVASYAFNLPNKKYDIGNDLNKQAALNFEYNQYKQDMMNLAARKRNRIQNDADDLVQSAKDNSGMPTATNSEFLDYAEKGEIPDRYDASDDTRKYLYAAYQPEGTSPSDSVKLMRNRLSPLDVMRNRISNESYAEEHPVLDKVAKAGELIGSALNVPYLNDLGKAREEGTLNRASGELMNPAASPKLLGSEALDVPLAAMNVGGVTSFGKAPVARALGNDSYKVLLKAKFPKSSLAYPDIGTDQVPSFTNKVKAVLDPSSSVGLENGIADKVVTAGRNFGYGAAPALKEDVVSDDKKTPAAVAGDVLGAGISSSLLGYGARRLNSGANMTEDMKDYVDKKINLGKAEALSDLAQTGDLNQPSVKSYLSVLNAQRKTEGLPPVDINELSADLRFSEKPKRYSENYTTESGFLSGDGQAPNRSMEIPGPTTKPMGDVFYPNEAVTPGYSPGYADQLLETHGLNRKNQYVGELGQTNPDDAQIAPPYTSELFGTDRRNIPKVLNTYKDVPNAIRGYAGVNTYISDSPYIFGRDLQKGSSFYDVSQKGYSSSGVPTSKNGIPITDLEDAEDILLQKGVNPTEAQKQQLIYMSNIPPEKAATVKSLGDDYLQTKAYEWPGYDRSLNARLDAASTPTKENDLESAAWLLAKGYQPTKNENELPESQSNDLSSFLYTSRYSPDFLRKLMKPDYVRIRESQH